MSQTRDVYVVSAARTAIGTFGGALKDTPPADLATVAVKAALVAAAIGPTSWLAGSGIKVVLRLAADRPDRVAAVCVVNPALTTRRKDVLALPLFKWVIPSFPGVANDIKKPGVDEHGYTRTPLKAVHSMMRAWPVLSALKPRLPTSIQRASGAASARRDGSISASASGSKNRLPGRTTCSGSAVPVWPAASVTA